jgi:hypothetical protein
MLQSFVTEDDYPKLINILQCVYTGTLKDDVSVLVISGGPSSGKSTLINLMRHLSQCGAVPIESLLRLNLRFNRSAVEPNFNLLEFLHPIVIGRIDDSPDIEDQLYKCHEIIRRGFVTRRLYDIINIINIDHPGALVVEVNEQCIIRGKKQSRNPMYLHLPNRFRHVPGVNVEAICLAEFMNIIGSKTNETETPNASQVD